MKSYQCALREAARNISVIVLFYNTVLSFDIFYRKKKLHKNISCFAQVLFVFSNLVRIFLLNFCVLSFYIVFSFLYFIFSRYSILFCFVYILFFQHFLFSFYVPFFPFISFSSNIVSCPPIIFPPVLNVLHFGFIQKTMLSFYQLSIHLHIYIYIVSEFHYFPNSFGRSVVKFQIRFPRFIVQAEFATRNYFY